MTSTGDHISSKRPLSPVMGYDDDSEEEYLWSSDEEDSICEDIDYSDDEGLTFRDKLKNLFIDLNLEQSKGTAILKLLRTHRFLSHLPADHRTLVNTPRGKIQPRVVSPGEYLHLGIETQLKVYLRSNGGLLVPNHLEIDISTDGANLDRQGTIDMWPIQIRISNIKESTPIIVGVYRGNKKPACPNDFFADFVNEWTKMQSNGGFVYEDQKITLSIRCVIADAPARAFLLCHMGHASPNSCSKCTVDGVPRTDESYVAQTDKHYHHGRGPLENLSVGMVSQVPFDGMHLSYLGSVKRQIRATIARGRRFSPYVRIDEVRIEIMNERMAMVSLYTPREFSRRTRDITQYPKMKATEFRQLILYTGPVINHGMYKKNVFEHYLLHHAALRCLSSAHPTPFHLNFAKIALKQWIHGCDTLYGEYFKSYNVHGHDHLYDDVQRLGPLDSFSAFPYENHMQFLRRLCRKPAQPLQQIYRRLHERTTRTLRHKDLPQFKSSQLYHEGPHPVDLAEENFLEYKLLKTPDFTLGVNLRDNCCILKDNTICLIQNILETVDCEEDNYILIVKKFTTSESWFNAGIDSTMLGSFKCSDLHPSLHRVNLREVGGKCYRTPYWPLPEDDALPPVYPLPGTFIATVML